MNISEWVSAGLIAVNIGFTLYMAYYKSYFTEKGKNLATVEDIGKITTQVEGIKNELSLQKDIKYSFKEIQRKAVVEFYERCIVLLSNLNYGLLVEIPFTKTDLNEEIKSNIKEAYYQFELASGKVNFYLNNHALQIDIINFGRAISDYRFDLLRALIEVQTKRRALHSETKSESEKFTELNDFTVALVNKKSEDTADLQKIWDLLIKLKINLNTLILSPE